MSKQMKVLLRGALLLVFVLGGSTPARAQLTVEPPSLMVTVPQGATETRTVTLTNTGAEPLAFCLSFERPLQRVAGAVGLRLSEEALGTACGPLGEILYEVSGQSANIGWNPFGLTMAPGGWLFAADIYRGRTHELTPALEVVRSFEHPSEDELDRHPATLGVSFNLHTGTLWWLNVEEQSLTVFRVLLLEGDLDGEPTGRRIELPLTGGDPPEDIHPARHSYDPATRRYYFGDRLTSKLWAVDTLGALVAGYPVEQQAYPGAAVAGPDAHGGASGEPEAVRLEMAVSLPGGEGADRLVVVDPLGRDLGAETPLPDVSGGSGFGSITGNPLRSRLDPNGVLYFPFVNFETRGVVGIRPHPLPPSWLSVEAWYGTLAPDESREVELTFRPGQRSVGEYTATLQAFEAATGEAVEVPLSLTVTQGTDAGGEAAGPAETSLAVYPNPFERSATVALSLGERSAVRLVVYDVLGRRVAVLADGEAAAGVHAFDLDAARLPAGLYLVRATGDGFEATRRITVLR